MTQTEEIKNRIDVVDLVGSYIKLQKAGSNFKACCPFHREKTPSFNVSPTRQIWHCFGCAKGGDIFEFVKEIEGVEFPEALKILADRAGVELKAEDPVLRGERGREFLLLEIATKFFEEQLAQAKGQVFQDFSQSRSGGKTRNPAAAGYAGLEKSGAEITPYVYLKSRGLTDETIKEFRLGYAPADWKTLFNHLLAKNFTAQEIERAGLIVRSQNSKFASQNYYDRFRGRIMFPIADYSGRVVAFSGRIFPERENDALGQSATVAAKYINSPETNLYQKSKILYGFNKSKADVLKEGSCVLVEGNMDMIMSWQAGVRNVAAISGTALTKEHLRSLGRICEKIYLGFDLDSAGVIANKRGVDLLKASLDENLEFDLRIVQLTGYKDAADAVLADPVIWQDAVKNSINIAQFYIDNSLKKYSANTPEAKREFQKNVLPLIASLNTLEQAHWVRVVGETLSINEDAVWDALRKLNRPVSANRPKIANPDSSEPKTRKTLLETKILSIISQYPVLADKIEADFMPLLSKETASAAVFAELFLNGAMEAETELSNCQRELKKEYLKEKRLAVFKEIQMMEKTGGDVDKLMSDFQNINNELSKLI